MLAWVLPDGTIVAEGTSPAITVYSWDAVARRVRLKSSVPTAGVEAFLREHHVDCDARGAQTPKFVALYHSPLHPGEHNPQVFYTRKHLKGIATGYRQSSLDGRAAEEVWKRMQPTGPQQLRRAFIVHRENVSFFFSFASLYGGPRQEMSRLGLFLHAFDGQVAGGWIRDVGPDGLCVDCAVPTFNDALEMTFPITNLFTAPHFPRPLLMLDTSTVEGRAVSLVTFTPDGKYSEYRIYEYVVNCFRE